MGGLRLRDIRVVDKSLLAMWRWKLLLEDDTLWKKVLMDKYVSNLVGEVEMGEGCGLHVH